MSFPFFTTPMLIFTYLSICPAIALCAVLGKKSLKDILIFIFLSTLFFYIRSMILLGFNLYCYLFLSFCFGLFYGLVCFLNFSISIRILKSRFLFLILSLFILSLNYLYFIFSSYKSGNSTEEIFYTIFSLKIIDPFLLTAAYATAIYFKKLANKYKFSKKKQG
jgi:hypothetical protein